MLDELRPLRVSDAARELGVDMLEVVRLLVASGSISDDLSLTSEQIDRLRELGGIEPSWWDGVDELADEDPRKARVRTALQLLDVRGHTGESATRMDNVWRGLPEHDQELLQDTLNVLGEEGHLTMTVSPVGVHVAITSTSAGTIREIIDGGGTTPGLAAYFGE